LIKVGLSSLIGVPIVYGDHVFGTLTLFNLDRRKRFKECDLGVAGELGRQTGIAIENARLRQSMRFYVRQVTRAQEDERKRIARELHDDTIQRLVVVSRGLESMSTSSQQLPEPAQERIAALEELLRETMRGVRRFVHDLRPPMLDHLGLVASVETLASELRESKGIPVEIKIGGEPRRLEPEEELVLFRIAQEAVGNTRRHSGASQAEVSLDFGMDYVRLSVSDNGCGFEVPSRIEDYVSQEKLGLIGMTERARTLGGSLGIRSKPGGGACITVEIPSAQRSEASSSPPSDQ
jgi:signal transduction histidine kinase